MSNGGASCDASGRIVESQRLNVLQRREGRSSFEVPIKCCPAHTSFSGQLIYRQRLVQMMTDIGEGLAHFGCVTTERVMNQWSGWAGE